MTLSPFMRLVLLAIALGSATVAGARLVESHEEGEFHSRDFIQEYVLARALLDGGDPYRPLPDLVASYFPDSPKVPWTHPTPHPPTVAILCMPMGLVDYRLASILWLTLELGCLALTIALLSRWWGEPVTLATRAGVFLLCLSFGPVIRELWLGQFGMILLVLVTVAWLELRRGNDWRGGACLGATLALKLVGWPILLLLGLQGRWRTLVAAAAVYLALHVAAWGVMGWQPIREYYLVIGPRVAGDNRAHLENFSLWTIGSRLFSPERNMWTDFVVIDSLHSHAAFERPVALALPLIALALALILAWRCASFDSAFGIVLCAGLTLNPVVWDHYLALTAVPLAVIARRLKDQHFPRGLTALWLLGLLIAIIPRPGDLNATVRWFGVLDEGVMRLNFAAGLMTYLPLVSLIAWIVLLVRTDPASQRRLS